jgi:hypothetical protein
MSVTPKTYHKKPFPLKRFLLYLVPLVLVCSVVMLFIVPPKFYAIDISPFLLLIIVWVIFIVAFKKRQKSTSLTLDESGLHYVQRDDELAIPWNGIKYYKRSLNKIGSTRNVIIVPYSGRSLLLGNFYEIGEIADYVEQLTQSLGKLSITERIRLSPLTMWFAKLILLIGLIGLIHFPQVSSGHFLSLFIMLVTGGLILLAQPSISAKAPRDLWKNRVKLFTFTFAIWIVVAIVLLIIFNSLYASRH